MKTYEAEQNFVKAYVSNHPYPSYNEMIGRLPLQQFAEYGELNHLWCKTIYENITDDVKITENVRGGSQALIQNFYTLSS